MTCALPLFAGRAERERNVMGSWGCDDSTLADPDGLRWYQREAYDAVMQGFWSNRSQLVVAATGTGKTQLFCAIAKHWTQGDVLILAHRDELIIQARDRLEQMTGQLVQVEKADWRADRRAKFVVGSIQTFKPKRMEKMGKDRFGLVILDEAHHGCAPTFKRVLDYFSEAKVLGVTATPDRADERALHAIFDDVAYVFDIEDGVDSGYLVPIRGKQVVMPQIDLSGVKLDKGDFDKAQLDDVMVKSAAAIVDKVIELAPDKQAILFFPGCKSAEFAHHRFETRAPGTSAYVDGSTDPDLRRQIMADYKAGKILRLCNCFDEETELLTRRGWVPGPLVRDSDTAATFNPSSGAIEWQPVSNHFVRELSDGERMVHVSNQSIDMLVTEGHRTVFRTAGAIRWKIDEAKLLPEHVSPYELPLCGMNQFPGVALRKCELEFLGLFATDGTMNKERASIEIAQSQESPNGKMVSAEIERILTECGFDWSVSERVQRSGHCPEGRLTRRYRIPKGNIGGKLARHGWFSLWWALDKSLADSLANMTSEQFEFLLYGLWLGDGYKSDRVSRKRANSFAICGINRGMFNRLQRWAVERGWASNLSWHPNGPGGDLGVLRLRKRPTVRTNNKFVATSGGNPAKFVSDYRGRVWCCSTPNTTVVVRRRGKVFVSGQCQVATEGFDAPAAEVVVPRLTLSRSLCAQMVGRVCRVLPGVVDDFPLKEQAALRRARIAQSKKPSCLWLDFHGNCGKHSLQTPEDILGGNYDEEEVKLAKKMREKKGGEGGGLEYLKAAREQIRHMAEAAKVDVTAHVRDFDPFNVFGLPLEAGDKYAVRFGRKPAEPWQVRLLLQTGFEERDLAGITRNAANSLLEEQKRRKAKKLCTYRQLRKLQQFGITDKDVSFARASEAIDYLQKECGWKHDRVSPMRLNEIINRPRDAGDGG